MNLVRQVFLAHLLLAVGLLAAGYVLLGYWMAALVFLGLGGLWFAAQLRRAPGIASLLLFILIPGGAVGIYLGMSGWLALVATVAALGAWDLDHFLQRLASAARVELNEGLGRAHLKRLAYVEGFGLVAGASALAVRTQLPFWWEVLLVILAVTGISSLIGLVRKQVED